MEEHAKTLYDLIPQTPIIALLVWMVIEERREKRRALIKLEECQEDRATEARKPNS